MKYFSHDTNACIDDKIMSLRMQFGGAAVDAYWTIIERLYHDEKPLVFGENRPETRSVTHWLCVGYDELKKWVEEMLSIQLLTNVSEEEDEIKLWSSRVEEQLAEIKKKAETARQNGKNGGRPPKEKTEKNPEETQSVSKKTQSKATKTKTKTISNSFPPIAPQIIDYLNEKTGKSFRVSSAKTQSLINARLNDGFELSDFRAVIDNRVAAWGKDPKMCEYLRPETLFGTKFESYLNAGRRRSDSAKYAD